MNKYLAYQWIRSITYGAACLCLSSLLPRKPVRVMPGMVRGVPTTPQKDLNASLSNFDNPLFSSDDPMIRGFGNPRSGHKDSFEIN